MKTQQEIENLKDEIQKKIEMVDLKLLSSSSEFEFNTFRDDKIRLVSQYNILIEVLK